MIRRSPVWLLGAITAASLTACAPGGAHDDDTVTVRSAANSTVVVTVRDGAGVLQSGIEVRALRNNGNIQAAAFTNASGLASLSLPANSYRFDVYESGSHFYSGASGHCVTPSCTTAQVTVTRVDVTVVNTSGGPLAGHLIWWESSGGADGGYVETAANGHAVIATPAESYRFVDMVNGFEFASGAAGHCVVPSCSAVTITEPPPVAVTVTNTSGVPQAGLNVGWEDALGETGGDVDTNASGAATVSMLPGSYRFAVWVGGMEFSSGPPNHCVVPGCTTASISVSAPVTVTVTDTAGTPIVSKAVSWVNASGDSGTGTQTNASGVSTVVPPLESVRFRVTVDGTQFFSGASVHCSQPGCTSATISVSLPTVVTIVDGAGAPISGRAVTPLSDEGITSGNKTTNASGQATFRLPFAHWRFRATCSANSEQFFSGNPGHCFIAGGCVTARIAMPCGQCAGQMAGAPCNDQNPCTASSSCQNQRCVGANLMACSPAGQCYDTGACSADTGACTNPPKANGTACEDNEVCSGTSTCQTGVCTGSNLKPEGTTCNDGQACTQSETCQAGRCQPPPAGYPPILNLAVEDLGKVGGTSASAADINTGGQTVGSAVNASGQTTAFLRSTGGPMADLGSQLGFTGPSTAAANNDAGMVVGSWTAPDGSHAFRYGPSGLVDLGLLGDGLPATDIFVYQGSYGQDINAQGQIVGHYTDGNQIHAFRYTDGAGFKALPSLAGGMTRAAAIDASGRVGGSSWVPGSPQTTDTRRLGHAVIFEDDLVDPIDLNDLIDPLLGWTLHAVTDMAGDFAVGTGELNGVLRPFRIRISNGAIDDLAMDDLWGGFEGRSFGSGVNSQGDVVGFGYRDAAETQAAGFVYSDSFGFKNVNDMIDPASGWNVRSASAINDAGDIVGSGTYGGVSSAYRVRLPLGGRATCQARGVCGGGDGDAICLYSDGVVETSPGHFVAVFGFDNASASSVQPTINQVRLDGNLVATPQPAPPALLPAGTHSGAYLPTFDSGHTIAWTVNGETVSASASSPRLTPVSLPGGGIGVVVGGTTIVVQAGLAPYSTPPTTEPTVQSEPQTGDPFNGVLSGQFAVGPSGAATYTVPIAIPPGIAGMAPNLSLIYNSQAGLGIAGQGWELGGLSVIHRCPRTRVQDGLGHQVSMDPDDPDEGVCLDGKRLFEQAGNLSYKLEQDDHSTITKVVGTPDPQNARTLGDVWFKVVTKTGETRYYGRDPRTRVVLGTEVAIWALERVMDVWGNYFDVNYNDATNFASDGLVVTSIDYTGHVPTASSGTGATPPFAHVTFAYDPRRERRSARFGSVTLPKNKRLKSITTSLKVANGDEMTGRYYIRYAADYQPGVNYSASNDAMLPTRLTTIDYCAGQNCPASPPTTAQERRQQGFLEPLEFEWDGGGYRWESAPNFAPPEPIERTGETSSRGSQFVDLDGDGRLDLVRSYGGYPTWDGLAYSKAWHNTAQGWVAAPSAWAPPAALVYANGSPLGAMFADVDGDGLADLVSRELVLCQPPDEYSTVCSSRPVVWLNRIRQNAGWQRQSGFETIPTPWNGSGFIDLTSVDKIADMNGDGKADLVRFGPGDTEMQVRYSTGAGWAVPSEGFGTASVFAMGSTPITQMRLEDVNRDGLPDIVWGSQNSFCHAGAYGINTGKNHSQAGYVSVWDARLPPGCASEMTSTPPDKRIVGDVDGDGFRDVMSSFKTKVVGTCDVPPQGGSQVCHCPTGCEGPVFCSTGGTPSCECGCPSGASGTEGPLLRFATGTAWTQNGADSFIASLMPFRPHPGENPIPQAARPDFIFAMADLNADGLADFILNHSNGGQVLINNGAGFDALEGDVGWVDSAGPLPERRVPVVPTEDKDFPSEGAAFVDLDGDGVTDLVQAKDTGGIVRNAWLNRFRPPVIKSFPNGLARRSEATYSVITTASAQASTYTDSATAPAAGATFFMTPLRVVESLSAEDGTATGTMFTTTYEYTGLRGSAHGRGPQGFATVKMIDGRVVTDLFSDLFSRKITETAYAQVYPYTGMPTVVERYVAVGGVGGPKADLTITQTSYCDNIAPSGACGQGEYPPGTSLFVYPKAVLDSSVFYNGEVAARISTHRMKRTTSYAYDTEGNPTTTTVKTELLDGTCQPENGCAWHRKKVENYYDSTPGSPPTETLRRLGKVTRSVVTSESNVTTDPYGIVHTTEFDYLTSHSYPPGEAAVDSVFLRRKRAEPGTPLEEHAVYGYDQFGNVATTRECGTDLAFCIFEPTPASPSRTTSVSYKVADFTPPPGGRVSSLPYGDGRFPVTTTNALGHHEYSAYDPVHGGLLQKTGPNGIHSCMMYDNFGRQISQTERCGSAGELTTSTVRFLPTAADPPLAKVVTRTRAPTGVASWAYADALGRATFARGRTFAGGFSDSFTLYDRWGRTVQQSTPRASDSTEPAYLTTTTYDEADRVRTIARDLGDIDGTGVSRHAIQTLSYYGTTVRTEHNVDGEDAAHLHQQPREETKGVLGKVQVVVQYLTPTVSTRMTYSYDADGNLTDTSDGANSVHLVYFTNGRRKLVRDPDLGEWHYTYTPFGEIETQTDANGKTVRMTYDKLGRIKSKKDEQTQHEARWAYDTAPGAGIGKLAGMAGEPDLRLQGPCSTPPETGLPSGEYRATRSFTYTPFGDLADEVNCVDGNQFVTSHGYDDFARESVLTYPQVDTARLSLRYNYTSLGFLHYVSDATDGSLYWAATARDAAGQVTSEYTRNGVETTSIRNQATGWLRGSSSVAHANGDTLIQSWSYGFDEVGNLRSRSRSDVVSGQPSVEAFTYDAFNRLAGSAVAVGTDNYSETYDIDTRGNLTRKGSKTYTYGIEGGCTTGGPHAVCTVDAGTQYQYDANGNMRVGGGRNVDYDLANKVVHIQTSVSAVDFVYGADGHRVVQEATGGGTTARTVYVGLGATGKSTYERTTRSDGVVEHTRFLYAPGSHNGNAFAIKVTRGGQTGATTTLSFNHFDHLGSVTAVSDEQGRVVTAAWGAGGATVAGYDPWGARRSPDGRPVDPASFQSLPGHREFTGHETIPGVGLVNMNGRVYDPSIGRFLSPDPNVQFVADLQSYNRYSYVLNNPLRYTDPTGYFLDSAGEMFGYLFGISAVAFCTAGFYVCAAATVVVIAYSATTMAQSGASFEQIVTINAVSIAAGFVGGVGVGAALGQGASIGAQMVGGAVSSMISTTITTAVMGGELGGEQMLVAAFSGACSAGLAARLRGTNPVSQKSETEVRGESDRPPGTLVAGDDLSVLKKSPKDCIIAGGGCNLTVRPNPNANGAKPWYELSYPASFLKDPGAIDFIDSAANSAGVDPTLLKAILYMENSHGYYDYAADALGLSMFKKSILPANINVSYWGTTFGTRLQLMNPAFNIGAGADMLARIQANVAPGTSIAQIATLYNYINASVVSDYGARVQQIYLTKPWAQ